nr:probably inactive leucine-rich repeat receptor-like protein kinase IMK2 [Tanacetum cinerariifolium]
MKWIDGVESVTCYIREYDLLAVLPFSSLHSFSYVGSKRQYLLTDGVDENTSNKVAAIDNDVCNPSIPSCHLFVDHIEEPTFNLENFKLTEAVDLSSALNELLQSDNTIALASGFDHVLLVFNYMPHGSLASFLHARGHESVINWPTRLNIIVGITKGLVFFNSQESIVHGNLTSRNVLLDEQKNPAIAYVGLSRLMTNAANTNVVATTGTLGYRAPEHSKLKKANPKTNVYSRSVIILELFTGKSPSKATDGLDLPQWVASIFKNKWTNEVFDLKLNGGSRKCWW